MDFAVPGRIQSVVLLAVQQAVKISVIAVEVDQELEHQFDFRPVCLKEGRIRAGQMFAIGTQDGAALPVDGDPTAFCRWTVARNGTTPLGS